MESVGFLPGRAVKFSPIIIISHDLSNVKSVWQFFFASNFEVCVCTAIDAVSNFYISWKLQLGYACQIFKLIEAAAFVKFYMLLEAATAAFCAAAN